MAPVSGLGSSPWQKDNTTTSRESGRDGEIASLATIHQTDVVLHEYLPVNTSNGMKGFGVVVLDHETSN